MPVKDGTAKHREKGLVWALVQVVVLLTAGLAGPAWAVQPSRLVVQITFDALSGLHAQGLVGQSQARKKP